MAITLVPITDLPQPPLKTDPANFAERADTFLDSLPDFVTETNAAITELNKITSGLDQTTPIAAWLVGTTYNFPDVVAGSDGYSYRCVDTAVIGVDPTTDDGTIWRRLTATFQVIAGNGLTGGGVLDANRTLTLGMPSAVSSASINSVTDASHTHALILPSVVKSRQHGTVDLLGGTTQNITIGWVDLSKALLVVAPQAIRTRCILSSSTNIQMVNYNSTMSAYIYWQVIEFD